jgi:hypothetical protein
MKVRRGWTTTWILFAPVGPPGLLALCPGLDLPWRKHQGLLVSMRASDLHQTGPRAHGLRNEITASKLCNAERPQMGSRSHRLLVTLEKFRMTRRNHERNEERFQAIFFERRLSFRNPWAEEDREKIDDLVANVSQPRHPRMRSFMASRTRLVHETTEPRRPLLQT